ncbi:MAG: hypothetical protein V1934_06680 [Methanobacteriota archaeon]
MAGPAPFACGAGAFTGSAGLEASAALDGSAFSFSNPVLPYLVPFSRRLRSSRSTRTYATAPTAAKAARPPTTLKPSMGTNSWLV